MEKILGGFFTAGKVFLYTYFLFFDKYFNKIFYKEKG